jgi:hypothetical protein
MKKIVLVAALLANLAYGQTPSVLVEACNAIQDADKRLECLKAAMNSTGATKKTPDSEALESAFSGMQSSLDVGISYQNYQTALLNVARETGFFKRSAAPNLMPAITKLEEAIDTYKDAGTFWEASIRFYANGDNSLAYSGGLPVQQVDLMWMVQKHQLPTRKADIWGLWVGVPTDEGRSAMWGKAKALSENGIALLHQMAKEGDLAAKP